MAAGAAWILAVVLVSLILARVFMHLLITVGKQRDYKIAQRHVENANRRIADQALARALGSHGGDSRLNSLGSLHMPAWQDSVLRGVGRSSSLPIVQDGGNCTDAQWQALTVVPKQYVNIAFPDGQVLLAARCDNDEKDEEDQNGTRDIEQGAPTAPIKESAPDKKSGKNLPEGDQALQSVRRQPAA